MGDVRQKAALLLVGLRRFTTVVNGNKVNFEGLAPTRIGVNPSHPDHKPIPRRRDDLHGELIRKAEFSVVDLSWLKSDGPWPVDREHSRGIHGDTAIVRGARSHDD
jgi:hypothetical protein